jgi:3',5'-cyclic-AMP phosphodiesterase
MITIAQITDTHLFADDSTQWKGINPDRTLNQIIAKVQQLDPLPDLILLTGDLSQDETVESYQRLRAKFEALNIPTYWLPGNHDRPELMAQILDNKPFKSDKTFKIRSWSFILLNSVINGHCEGFLTTDTISNLRSELEQDQSPTLIAVHHHPLDIGSWFMDPMKLKNGAELINLVGEFTQVKMVIFGHIHSVFDSNLDGVRYLGCPSTCLQLKHNDPTCNIDDVPPGFRRLFLEDDGTFTTKIERITKEELL